MKFLDLYYFHKEVAFGDIVGYDDIKSIVSRVLSSDESYNLLFCGPPASAKTLFLLGILECRKGVYFDGSNTTNRILDVLEEERPRIICIDELDKMSRQFQNQLLNFLEDGLKWTSSAGLMILKSKVPRSLPHAMKLIGYPNLCNRALDVCTYRLIQRSSS